MPTPNSSPTADAIEAILDTHVITDTFETRHPARSGNTCACGTRHPLDGGGPFPSHIEHLAALIDEHFPTRPSRSLVPLVRTMSRHTLARSFTKHLPAYREVDECRCSTQHPTSYDGRFATHRRHLAEHLAHEVDTQIAALLPAPQ